MSQRPQAMRPRREILTSGDLSHPINGVHADARNRMIVQQQMAAVDA